MQFLGGVCSLQSFSVSHANCTVLWWRRTLSVGDCDQGDTLMAPQKQLEDLTVYIKHITCVDVIAFDKKGAYSMAFDYLKWLKLTPQVKGSLTKWWSWAIQLSRMSLLPKQCFIMNHGILLIDDELYTLHKRRTLMVMAGETTTTPSSPTTLLNQQPLPGVPGQLIREWPPFSKVNRPQWN